MKFAELLEIVTNEPVFEVGLLLAGDRDPAHVRRQVSRWVETGRLYQLRRGLYALAPPFRKTQPHPFLVANRLVRGSYVSLQSALAHHGWIPEHVPVTTSVGPGRNQRRSTPLGVFDFRHLKPTLRAGARWVELGGGQRALVASPEKALLDLIYLVPGADAPEYLDQLRLQNLERLDHAELALLERAAGKPKLSRAVAWIRNAAETEAEEYELL